MQLANLIILSATVTGALAAPQVQFPLPDGFPNPLPDQLAQIEKNAGGTLTNAFLPASFKSGAITALQLLANNEISEVAFFTELLNNITNNVPGYDITATAPLGRDFLIESISAIKNVSLPHYPRSGHLMLTRIPPARRATRLGRQRNPRRRQPIPHSTLPIHLPRHHLPRSHPPRPNLHRPRSIHRPSNPIRPRHRRRHRNPQCLPLRLRPRPRSPTRQLFPLHTRKTSLRSPLPNNRRRRLRLHRTAPIHRPELVPETAR